MICPACGQPNIDGSDWCEQCSESLTTVPTRPPRKTMIERRIESTTVGSLNPPIPVCVSPAETVENTIKLIAAKNIGCVLVVWCHALVGIFSERDALMKIGTRLNEVRHEPIRHFMTPAPETLGPQDTIAFAINRMAIGGFRHVPIEDDERPVGIISVRDILRYVTQQFPEILTTQTTSSEGR